MSPFLAKVLRCSPHTASQAWALPLVGSVLFLLLVWLWAFHFKENAFWFFSIVGIGPIASQCAPWPERAHSPSACPRSFKSSTNCGMCRIRQPPVSVLQIEHDFVLHGKQAPPCNRVRLTPKNLFGGSTNDPMTEKRAGNPTTSRESILCFADHVSRSEPQRRTLALRPEMLQGTESARKGNRFKAFSRRRRKQVFPALLANVRPRHDRGERSRHTEPV